MPDIVTEGVSSAPTAFFSLLLCFHVGNLKEVETGKWAWADPKQVAGDADDGQ